MQPMAMPPMSGSRSMAVLRHGGDEIDLHEAPGDEQARRADRRARRRRGEELLPHLVEGLEVHQVRVEDLGLDDLLHRGARGFEGAREVLEDVARLALDV